MPSGMQSLDLGQPTINEGQTLEEKLQLILNYNLELMQSLRYILSNLGQENFNPQELEDMTAPVLKQIENFEGDLLEVALEAGRASMTASDAYGKAQQLEFTVDGFTVRNLDGSTTIDGNKIRSGTIEGVKVLSKSGNNTVELDGATITIRDEYGGLVTIHPVPYGAYIQAYGGILYLTGDLQLGLYDETNIGGSVVRIASNGNASISAGGTLYLGSTYGGGGVKIGYPGSTVTIEGDLIINGVPYMPAGGGGGEE